ncbi:hypothetical protein yc1106_02304 [Curvularia clavata]|uniref:Serine hydrolase domain-containing protein n=1 Tax=Curvularia clavata TaxID=95742 RepID=A0A9Q8Z3J3_CURCL|nr:hypothetical protein yc1106_02304 [Curvularia clavata]
MRFLCLHGMGTNSSIFETQIAGMCQQLQDQGHEFIFVDGLIECDAAPGIGSLFPGPYLCYYDLPTPEKVQSAFDYINEVIEEEGPFDGVFGFSQGAALASSMMLEHYKRNPLDDLFKFAVFIAASLPFNLDDTTGMRHWESAVRKAIQGAPAAFGGEFAGELIVDEGSGSSEDEDSETHTRGFPLRPWMLGTKTLLGRYHPSRDKVRIQVPTLHIMSDVDQYLAQSENLVKLCNSELSSVVKHDAGHRVPRSKDFEVKATAGLDAVVRSSLMRT